MSLISVIIVMLILGVLSVVVLNSVSGDNPACAPGRTTTTLLVELPPGVKDVLNHC